MDALPGVVNAVVSLIQQQARIDYAASVVSPVNSDICPFLLALLVHLLQRECDIRICSQ